MIKYVYTQKINKGFLNNENKKYNEVINYKIREIDSKFAINQLINYIKKLGYEAKIVSSSKIRSNKKTFSAKNLINLQLGRGEHAAFVYTLTFSIDYTDVTE
jgi:hypothetical protein